MKKITLMSIIILLSTSLILFFSIYHLYRWQKTKTYNEEAKVALENKNFTTAIEKYLSSIEINPDIKIKASLANAYYGAILEELNETRQYKKSIFYADKLYDLFDEIYSNERQKNFAKANIITLKYSINNGWSQIYNSAIPKLYPHELVSSININENSVDLMKQEEVIMNHLKTALTEEPPNIKLSALSIGHIDNRVPNDYAIYETMGIIKSLYSFDKDDISLAKEYFIKAGGKDKYSELETLDEIINYRESNFLQKNQGSELKSYISQAFSWGVSPNSKLLAIRQLQICQNNLTEQNRTYYNDAFLEITYPIIFGIQSYPWIPAKENIRVIKQ